MAKKAVRALAENDLIGLEARVAKSSDPALEGVHGMIADETMNTIELRAESRTLTLDKKSVSLAIRFPCGEIEVSGRSMMQRPEERLKKLWTKVK